MSEAMYLYDTGRRGADMRKKVLDGNGAAAEAMRLARPKVIALYPITPQSSISEKPGRICR